MMSTCCLVWFAVISLVFSQYNGSGIKLVDGMIVKHFRPKTDANDASTTMRSSFRSQSSSGESSQSPSNKPLCTVIKNTVPGMKDGNFITRDPGHWRLLPDGSRNYEPQTCSLQRFTADEARQCLSGHHLLMIGDSIMRFQFLSLAYFIEHGRWEHRFPMSENCQHKNSQGEAQCSPWNEPNILTEKDWAKVYGHSADKSWKEMQSFIGGKAFNGHLDCQCFRHNDIDKSIESLFYQNSFQPPMSLPSPSSNIISSTNSIAEIPHPQPTHRPFAVSSENMRNRRPSFQSRPNSSHHSHGIYVKHGRHLSDSPTSAANEKTIKLTFLVNLNNSDVRLLPRSHCEKTGSCGYNNELREKILEDIESGKRWALDDSLLTALDRTLPKVLPDVDIAIYNNGLWAGGYPNVNIISQVMDRLYNLTHQHGDSTSGRCFWKGTSPAFHIPGLKKYPSQFAAADEPYRIVATKAGCHVFDIAHVTKSFAVFNYQGGRRKEEFEDEQMNVFADAAHFQPWVNEELNQILLNVLC